MWGKGLPSWPLGTIRYNHFLVIIPLIHLHPLNPSNAPPSVVGGVHCGPPLPGRVVLIVREVVHHCRRRLVNNLPRIVAEEHAWAMRCTIEILAHSPVAWLMDPNQATIPRCSREARTTRGGRRWAAAAGWAGPRPRRSRRTGEGTDPFV